mmetsp:Transcript_11019/g.16724  ORF Transcript_11019/g.16724 Transcript_11019/m.16724 type:complete len:108 (+) Transcript_11019:484-807(+)
MKQNSKINMKDVTHMIEHRKFWPSKFKPKRPGKDADNSNDRMSVRSSTGGKSSSQESKEESSGSSASKRGEDRQENEDMEDEGGERDNEDEGDEDSPEGFDSDQERR